MGIGVEPIGLLFRQDVPLVAAMFGVLRAGKTFTSLDHNFPPKYLAEILGLLRARLLVVDPENYLLARQILPAGCSILVYEPGGTTSGAPITGVPVSADDPFVISFTSGSTGIPKGIAVSHRGYLDRFWRGGQMMPTFPGDRHSQITSVGFLGSVSDILRSLLNGCTLCMVDLRAGNLASLASWLNDESITIFRSPISFMRIFFSSLAEKAYFPSLRMLSLSGEVLYKQDIERVKVHIPEKCILEYRYAASEIIVGALWFFTVNTEHPSDRVAAGFPFGDREIWTVGEDRQRLKTGETGRIAVRSRFLADGYFNLPELTAQHYANDPIDPKKRIFFSNDFGRILPNGMLEFLGRSDDMEKIRGFRVELSAIVAALLQIGMKQAAVIAQTDPDGEKHLVAYLVPPDGGDRDPLRTRSELASKLPDYMLPDYYLFLECLPMLPSGKLDRISLPNPFLPPEKPGSEIQVDDRELDPLEKQVLEIVRLTLKQHRIGVNDNIFVFGCSSLLAARMVSGINDASGLELAIREIYQFPSAASLAGRIRSGKQTGLPKAPVQGLDANALDYLRQFG